MVQNNFYQNQNISQFKFMINHLDLQRQHLLKNISENINEKNRKQLLLSKLLDLFNFSECLKSLYQEEYKINFSPNQIKISCSAQFVQRADQKKNNTKKPQCSSNLKWLYFNLRYFAQLYYSFKQAQFKTETVINISTLKVLMQLIKRQFFWTPVQKSLNNLKLNSDPCYLGIAQIRQIQNLLERDRLQIMKILKRYLKSNHIELRLKVLIIIHRKIKESFDPDFIEIIQNLESAADNKKRKDLIILVQLERQYILYLKKLCTLLELHKFIKAYDTRLNQKNDDCQTTISEQEQNTSSLVRNGFQTLNIINTILRLQNTLKETGRYYLDHGEVFSVYLEILRDMSLYNNYIKESVYAVIESFSHKQQERHNFKNTLSLKSVDKKIVEEMQEKFLYINEAQDISGKLYEFYHNKYYYPQLKQLVFFPQFLVISQKDYEKMIQTMKKIDKKFLHSFNNHTNETQKLSRNKSCSISRLILRKSQKQGQIISLINRPKSTLKD